MNRNLFTAIMQRTKLRNIFLKNRTEENNKNLCVTLLRKSKREYFNNLNEKNVCDNKKFCRVFKPLLSNKGISKEKIKIVEGDKIVRRYKETAKVLNEFFSNVVTNLNIPQFNQIDRISENFSDPFIKAIVKHRAHPSIIAGKKTVLLNLILIFRLLKKQIFWKRIKCCNQIKQHKIPLCLLNWLKIMQKFLRNLFLSASISELNCQFSHRN